MTKTCDRCGESTVPRGQDTQTEEQGPVRRSSSEAWWDCSCGRTIAEFGASTALTMPFTLEDQE